jgi:hypothetical protein
MLALRRMRDASINAKFPEPELEFPIMNDRPHSAHGKIDLHGEGLGVPSPDLVTKRAREIAMIDERNPDEFTEADWNQAKSELLGVEPDRVPEGGDKIGDELTEWDDIAGASGHRVPKNGFDEEETLGEELVTEGIDEAAHDTMVEARREEIEEERKEK